MQLGRTKIRVVTHLDVTREDAERAAEALSTIPR
jgi:threonine aldolase